jgi:hypothetical protein
VAVQGSKRAGHRCIVAAQARERRAETVTQKRSRAAIGRAAGSSILGALPAAPRA